MKFRARSALRGAIAVLALGAASAIPMLPTDASATTATPACSASMLHIRLGLSDGAAGTSYQRVRFLNTSSTACTLNGYPRFVYLDGSGNRIGFPAKHGGRHHAVTIRPGKVGIAALGIPDYLNFPPARCHAEDTAKLRVRAPGTNHGTRLRFKATVCTTAVGRSTSLAVRHQY